MPLLLNIAGEHAVVIGAGRQPTESDLPLRIPWPVVTGRKQPADQAERKPMPIHRRGSLLISIQPADGVGRSSSKVCVIGNHAAVGRLWSRSFRKRRFVATSTRSDDPTPFDFRKHRLRGNYFSYFCAPTATLLPAPGRQVLLPDGRVIRYIEDWLHLSVFDHFSCAIDRD